MSGVEWVGAVRRPRDEQNCRVERHPARAEPEGARFAPLARPMEVHALGLSFRLDQLPYLLAFAAERPIVPLPLALYEEDLVMLGFGLFAELTEAGPGTALIAEALQVGRETGRRRLVAPVTNADIVALFFLQTQGFAIAQMRPYSGPQRQGAAGLVSAQELELVRPLR